MINRIIIISTLCVSIAGFSIGCKDSGTGPDQKPFKDPRQMIWTADTLSPSSDAIQLMPVSMLAFSPNDVWLACWSDVAQRVMWHYDGTAWKESNIEEQSGPIGLDALAGTSSNDLWAGGFYGIPNSFIALSHYYNKIWTRIDLKIPGEILSMCTDPDGSIWACGKNGIVLKYSQGQWSVDTIKIAGFSQTDCYLYSVKYYNGRIYTLARNDANTQFAFVFGNIKNWVLLDTFPKTSASSIIKWGTLGLSNEISGKLYSYGLTGIWELGSSGWIRILDLTSAIRNVAGPAGDYLIGVGAFRNIQFYDGNVWQNIGNMIKVDPGYAFNNVWTDGYEIIIAAYSTINGIQKTVIWHGK